MVYLMHSISILYLYCIILYTDITDVIVISDEEEEVDEKEEDGAGKGVNGKEVVDGKDGLEQLLGIHPQIHLFFHLFVNILCTI